MLPSVTEVLSGYQTVSKLELLELGYSCKFNRHSKT